MNGFGGKLTGWGRERLLSVSLQKPSKPTERRRRK
jgi:hypothetical protein